MSAARVFAALGALLGLFGLIVEYLIMLEDMAPALATWRYFAYFTILTNCLVLVVLGRAALKPGADDGPNAPRFELMALTSILFVCAVYNLLLASRWEPQGWQLAADIAVHQGTPLLCALYWLARPRGRLAWKDALFAAVWPMAYAAYGLARGTLDGFYPYFFMDASTTAWPALALNVAVLAGAFMVGAVLIIALDRALARR